MASKETQGSLLLVAVLAGTVGIVAFVALMVLGGFGFNPAFFLAIFVALVVAVILYRGFHHKPDHPGDGGARSVKDGAGHGTAGTSTGTAAAGAASASASASSASAATGPGASAVDATPAAGGAAAPAAPAAKGTSEAEAPASAAMAPKTTAPAAAPASAAPAAAPPKADPTPADQPSGTGATAGTAPADVKAEDKPAMMDKPRDGGPDNLKEIKGIGPKLEVMLNGMGVYHFDQIAGWTERELAWVDQNLEGFKGRASRDNWVSQAKTLATGAETEFSTRVQKGNVY
ncbi:hypothetical protein [Anianabacter salinae]|uniref:hypothetical protein n=1 Tax=Anianabacter salinae TaxID=2851023 RepID=UPI00225E06F0|nr:hypothetical protein [Anianabacter salinae]MBV0911433.1 hypothetical protein [Anianabacter salinae]